MKPLPVIQPPPPNAAASPVEPHPLQTADMVSDPDRRASLMPQIVRALSTVFDPEIPVNIYDLGLIYEVIVDASNRVGIRMTLTAPAWVAYAAVKKRIDLVGFKVGWMAGQARP